MRRSALAVLLVVALLALSAASAGAGPTKTMHSTLSGSAEWNALQYPSSFTISGRVQNGKANAGTYAGTLAAGTFAGCPDNPYGPQCAPVTGSLTLDLKGGSITAAVQPRGTVWQVYPTPSHETYVFQLSLDVTSGTRAYASASGTLSLYYNTTRDNLATDPVTLAPCAFVDVTSCPISDSGTLIGTISR